ncbi:WG repeat protein [Mucilaginibacter gracilis]|uniref:WG repeat protein n=1 Tax=Mucilaginibacter gracilis TaxID=423350 RepID=A0A495IVZ5_9SPHI|nr:YARHG domain-containing protein [Mucilaginibacter gracilis]RKR80890.1 WG repeat protein [Mucilaginibacter gracilis]
MKKKPIIIITSVLVLALCCFLFIRSKYLPKPEKKEVIVFLDMFNADLKQGSQDTLLTYFEGKQNNKQLLKLLSVLSNKKSLNGRDAALFDVNLISGDSEIKILNTEFIEAQVPVEFKENGSNLKKTVITIKIRKISAENFKITQIDARRFMSDYIAYGKDIKHIIHKGTPADSGYRPITIAAFKAAEILRSKYDSVIWFNYVNERTFFYVINGKWDINHEWYEKDGHTEYEFKMGLVSPDMKEIIPLEYDLIHNISGTIAGLIEVEKKHKKGLYNITGKVIAPADYDQIIPLTGNENLAVLKMASDYFYLKRDFTISPKLEDFKITDVLPQIKLYNASYTLSDSTLDKNNIMELNSHDEDAAVVIPPSYLVDWKILPSHFSFNNPFRPGKEGDDEGLTASYQITFESKHDEGSWLQTAYSSIVDNYLGARSGFYEEKKVLLVDKKHNAVYGYSAKKDYSDYDDNSHPLSGKCDINNLRPINDTMYEFKFSSFLGLHLYSDNVLQEAPTYHYLVVKNNVLDELPNQRLFGFTKFIKMDDSYLNACYVYQDKKTAQLTSDVLQYMKNEIFAEYHYQFKNPKWTELFQNTFNRYNRQLRANVDDSLTAIDKYNINWIANKLKQTKQPQTLASK